MDLLKVGEGNRVKRATKMNNSSSRSHSIFQVLIEYDKVDENGMIRKAKLNLCDLAGSEKLLSDETDLYLSVDNERKLSQQKAHFIELKNINLSLTTLGKVISLLAKPLQLKQIT